MLFFLLFFSSIFALKILTRQTRRYHHLDGNRLLYARKSSELNKIIYIKEDGLAWYKGATHVCTTQ